MPKPDRLGDARLPAELSIGELEVWSLRIGRLRRIRSVPPYPTSDEMLRLLIMFPQPESHRPRLDEYWQICDGKIDALIFAVRKAS